MIYKVLAGVFFLIIVVYLILGNNYKKERNLYEKTLQDEFNAKYAEQSRKLKQSEDTRLRLDHDIDSLNLLSKTLSESKLKVDKELKAIKGKYANRTPSELEQLMIDKARK